MAEVLAISLPMVISHACDTVMVFTDRLFLARLDPELMNAALGGGLTAFMMISFFVGLVGFTTALVAQHLGAGRKKDCAVVLTQALIFSCCAYPLILLLRPAAYWLFGFVGVGAEQLGPQTLYLNILLYGSIISLARMALSGFFSGIARTRIVMAASVAAMFTNVGLDYVFIFGKFGFPAMGIRGAAYATILGGVVGLIILSTAYFSGRNRKEYSIENSFRFDKALAGKLLRYGTPTGFEMCLNIIAFNVMIMMFHSLGPATATAATVVFNWDFVSFVPLIGIEIGVTSLVGRYMGAGHPDKAHHSVMSGLKLGITYSVFIFILFIGFPGRLVDVFRPAVASAVFASAVPTAVFMVRLASVYVLVEVMLCVFIGALRGAGDTFWAMRTSVILHWLMVIVLALILRVLRLAPEIGWAAMVFFFLVFSAVVFMRYREGEWRKIRIVEPVVPPEMIPDIGEV
ncbi:MAG: MATE family efflux transporter [Candidatus Omnitrophica bacterium]|nr:MATE family efflux transporter [Candidatus Omnitrophota bacterium]